MLERYVQKSVEHWIAFGRNAFLLTGARQIGKTYLIRECLKKSKVTYVELNFIEQPELVDLFASALNSKDLLMRLSLISPQRLVPGETIVFLDEVQECKEIITKIKFLVEDGSYRYIMSGSLLGVELNDLRSAPVGYLQIQDMYPMGFLEFASAVGVGTETMDVLQKSYTDRVPVDDYIHSKMLEIFYLYLIIGGMPEAVQVYLETNDLSRVAEVQNNIIRLYRMDFTKYEEHSKLKLREVYDSIPGQLNQQNKRFQLNSIGKGISYDRAENNFLWLKDAGVAIPVYNVDEPKLPLVTGEKRNLFKLFLSDVGLLTNSYSTSVKMDILNRRSDINNGALFENVVAQELLFHGFKEYYFNNKKQGELDFVIELDGQVTPLEIKSGKEYKRHSALSNVLGDPNYAIREAYVFSEGNVEVNGKLVYLPIYMIMFLKNTEAANTIYRIDVSGLK